MSHPGIVTLPPTDEGIFGKCSPEYQPFITSVATESAQRATRVMKVDTRENIFRRFPSKGWG